MDKNIPNKAFVKRTTISVVNKNVDFLVNCLPKNVGISITEKFFLNSFDKESITILIDDKEIKLDRKNISQIKTVYNW